MWNKARLSTPPAWRGSAFLYLFRAETCIKWTIGGKKNPLRYVQGIWFIFEGSALFLA